MVTRVFHINFSLLSLFVALDLCPIGTIFLHLNSSFVTSLPTPSYNYSITIVSYFPFWLYVNSPYFTILIEEKFMILLEIVVVRYNCNVKNTMRAPRLIGPQQSRRLQSGHQTNSPGRLRGHQKNSSGRFRGHQTSSQGRLRGHQTNSSGRFRGHQTNSPGRLRGQQSR